MKPAGLRRRRRRRCGFRIRPGSSHLDPGSEVCDLFVGQFARRGHLELFLVAHDRDQTAVFRFARNHDGAAFASFEKTRGRGQVKAGHLKFGTMAFEAVLREHRPDLRFEEFGGARGLSGGSAAKKCREQNYKGTRDESHKWPEYNRSNFAAATR